MFLLSVKPGGLKNHMRNVKTNSFSDDEPAYDTVASDEDYSSIGDRASIMESTIAAIAEHPAEQSLQVCYHSVHKIAILYIHYTFLVITY